jgi:hypothetical protein
VANRPMRPVDSPWEWGWEEAAAGAAVCVLGMLFMMEPR